MKKGENRGKREIVPMWLTRDYKATRGINSQSGLGEGPRVKPREG